MKIISRTLHFIGFSVTALVILASISTISRYAIEHYEIDGAYFTELLSWRQEYPGRGELIILGKKIPIDLKRTSELSNKIESIGERFVAHLPNSISEKLKGSWRVITDTSESLIHYLFNKTQLNRANP